MRIYPVQMIQFCDTRPSAVVARKARMKRNPHCVYLIEKVNRGWGVYQGGM